MESEYLQNRVLIAMPGAEDPFFSRSVCYVCDHDERGAVGIVINHPTELHVPDIMQQLLINNENPELLLQPILSGGPVQQERGFVLHPCLAKDPWVSSVTLGDISITTSRDILEALAKQKGPKQALVSLGFSAWGPGQLEEELKANFWLVSEVDTDLIFNIPYEERWQYAIRQLGIDPVMLSGQSGNA